jgi:hypothetical protein
MKRFIATIFVLSALASSLAYQSIVQPKATASPAPIIDHSAELAALQAENADLKESLRVAQSAIHAAPLAVIAPGGGDVAHVAQTVEPLICNQQVVGSIPTGASGAWPAEGLETPRHREAENVRFRSIAPNQPAAQGPRYQYQSRSSQPRRLFGGRIFGRR